MATATYQNPVTGGKALTESARSEPRATEICFDRLFERAKTAVARRIGSEQEASLVATESLGRLLESPLWAISLRRGLPLEPLVQRCLEQVTAEWEAGWRPPVA